MRKLVLTFFGAGLSPAAPGTVGSLAISGLLAAASLADFSGPVWQIFLVLGVALASLLMVILGPWAVAHFGRKDPQPVVLDEVAGIFLTNLFLPRVDHPVVAVAVAFAAFRLFDVTKPPPARQLENLPAGWGILCDDLAAAVYANLLCQVVLRVHF